MLMKWTLIAFGIAAIVLFVLSKVLAIPEPAPAGAPEAAAAGTGGADVAVDRHHPVRARRGPARPRPDGNGAPMTLDEKVDQVPGPARRLPLQGRQGPGHLRGQGGLAPSRVRSYFQDSRVRDPKTDALVGQIRDLDVIVTANELEALILESTLVKRHRPRYNIILSDDKHYPFLKLTTDEEYPRLVVARRVQKDGAAYFGPFYPATAMRQTLRLVRQLFPLRTCRIKIDGALPRPCLQYFIHRCKAPCTGWETREGYAETVREVAQFLEGKGDTLAMELTREMEAAAGDLKFERAAGLRDQIQALNTVRERQKMISTEEADQDIVGIVHQGADACVQLFFVRKGRLLGRESFFFERLAGSTPRDVSRRLHPPVLREGRHAAPGDPPVGGAARGRADGRVARAAARGRASSSSCPSAGPSASSSPWPRRTPCSRSRRTSCRAAAGITPCWRSSSGRSALPGPPHRIEGFDISTHPGQRDGRLDGGVAGRRHEEGRLQTV